MNRRRYSEFVSSQDPNNIGSCGRPMCHDFFMYVYPGLFPKCNFYGLDKKGFCKNPDYPEYDLPSDECILRSNKIDDEDDDGNTICDKVSMGIGSRFGLREKLFLLD